MRRGLALLLAVGVLGVLAILGVAFVMMARLERKASQQRLQATKALLLARSGIEDALARMEAGQDPAYGGEDWLGDGDNGPGSFDRQQEVYRPGTLDVASCPARHALRPSFFARDGFATPRPALQDVDGRMRGSSGALAEGGYALKVEDLNARICVNGGALDDLDRDPDGALRAGQDRPHQPLSRRAAWPPGSGFLARRVDTVRRLR